MGNKRIVTMLSLLFVLIINTLGASQYDVCVSAAKKAKLSVKKITIQKGKTKKVSVKYAKRKKIKWTIKKKSVASLKKSGKYAVKVKGKKKGTTILTCRVKFGKKWKVLTCKVTVSERQRRLQTPVTGDDQEGAGQTTTAPGISGPMPSTTPCGDSNVFKTACFEGGTDGFEAYGNARISVVEDGHTGKGLLVSERAAASHGTAVDVLTTMEKGATYKFSAWVKQNAGIDRNINLSMEEKTGTDTYQFLIAKVLCKSGSWTYVEGTYTVPLSLEGLQFFLEGPDGTYDFLVDDVAIQKESLDRENVDPFALPSLKEAYGEIFERFGNALSYNTSWNEGYQMQSEQTMKFVQKQFNSYTLENEMKPDQLYPSWKETISISEAEERGYVIPDHYKEAVAPDLRLDKLDRILEISHQYGIQMRAHVLMWHQQTSTKFFRVDYDDNKEIVSKEVMDARLELYIRSVMKYVMEKEKQLTGRAGTIVYCWDVTNEYIHRTHHPTFPSWMDVYGDMGLRPSYVKLAYQIAYDMLKQYGIEKDITLFYNDYDEYECSDEMIELVNYINEGEPAKICGGIGMQSHTSVDDPDIGTYGIAVDKFLATGLQIQVTELDAGIDFGEQTAEDQARYYSEIMTLLVTKHKNRDKNVNPRGITGVTIWGLCDELSWRGDNPLLFGVDISDPKPSFYSVLEAGRRWKVM